MSDNYTEGTMFSLEMAADRWGITLEQVTEFADLYPRMAEYDHMLADGTGLYPWRTIEGAEEVFPELRDGRLEKAMRMLRAMHELVGSWGIDNSDTFEDAMLARAHRLAREAA